MTKHIVDSELLDQAVAAIEKEMCVQCDGISCCRPKSLTTLGRLRAILAQPAADCWLEVVAWQDAENPLYTTGEKRQMHGWATDGYPIVELIRKSDADARIAELEAQRDELIGIAFELFSGADCHTVHHEKSEYHGGSDKCPVIERIRKTLVRIGGKPNE